MPHGGEFLRVTVSIGATRIVARDTVDGLVKRADELMCRSKLVGRNQVTSDQ